MSVLTYRQAAV